MENSKNILHAALAHIDNSKNVNASLFFGELVQMSKFLSNEQVENLSRYLVVKLSAGENIHIIRDEKTILHVVENPMYKLLHPNE